MRKKLSFLWLHGIFDQKTLEHYPYTSPASNFWNREFALTLQSLFNKVKVIGHATEKVWPIGRLHVLEDISIASGLCGDIISYYNIFILKDFSQLINYKKITKKIIKKDKNFDFSVTYSSLKNSNDYNSSIQHARFLKKKYNLKWINIVGDGQAPAGADYYVFQTWDHFNNNTNSIKKMHLDGGVRINIKKSNQPHERFIAYMGSLSSHGGAENLAKAFHKTQIKNLKLFLCGQGDNERIRELSRQDTRIQVKGFLTEQELIELAQNAFAFVNPRLNSHTPNKFNFPSKLLFYLAFNKPIISTKSSTIHPEYDDVLFWFEDETQRGFMKAIEKINSIDKQEYEKMVDKISNFSKKHSWDYQINRFINFLNGGLN